MNPYEIDEYTHLTAYNFVRGQLGEIDPSEPEYVTALQNLFDMEESIFEYTPLGYDYLAEFVLPSSGTIIHADVYGNAYVTGTIEPKKVW